MILRPVRPEDFEAVFTMQSDPESCAMAAFPARDRERAQATFDRSLADPTGYFFVIEHDGAVVGNVMSWLAEDRRLLGYWIDRSQWGKGIASEAVTIALSQIADRPIHAYVVESNAGSRRVLEKSGFEFVSQEDVEDPDFGPLVEMLFVLR